ncbi:hypothetical protein D0T60_07260 [Bacteroides sp. 224]|nr:hypothetical protein [Bacteroides sp. 224]
METQFISYKTLSNKKSSKEAYIMKTVNQIDLPEKQKIRKRIHEIHLLTYKGETNNYSCSKTKVANKQTDKRFDIHQKSTNLNTFRSPIICKTKQ